MGLTNFIQKVWLCPVPPDTTLYDHTKIQKKTKDPILRSCPTNRSLERQTRWTDPIFRTLLANPGGPIKGETWGNFRN